MNGIQSDNSATNAGAVYVFVQSGGKWSQQGYLKASNTEAGDNFGMSVAIYGDTAVVGAFGEDSAATGVNGNQSNNSAADAGAVYVFLRTGVTWSQQAYLKASNTGAGDWFGSLAIFQDTIVVGAYREDSNSIGVDGTQDNDNAIEAGAAYVFARSGGTWSQQAYLKPSNTGAGDRFGWGVSISNDTIVIGAYAEDSNATGVNGTQSDNSALEAGAAYVFVRVGVTWSQQAYLKASNTNAPDHFGYSVAISGDTAVVGATLEASGASGVNSNQNDNSATEAGAAYVFVRSGAAWSQQAYLKPSNSGSYDWFGRIVDISGDLIAVAAQREDGSSAGVNGSDNNAATDAGAVYVFTRTGSTWSQQAYLKASNASTSDWFGHGVSVFLDKLAIGAALEDSGATGVDGDQASNAATNAGAAYIFGAPIAITPTNQTASAGGTLGQFVLVNAESWQTWSAASHAAWLTVTAGASGTGNGTVTYNIAANTSANSRTGTLTIGGQTFTVTQSGVTPTYAFASASATATATAGSGSVGVTVTPSDATWTPTSNAAWLTLSSTPVTGSTTLSYSYTANGNVASRTGTITVGGQSFTVTQAGASYTLANTTTAVPSNAGTSSFAITVTPNDASWTATSNAAWLTVSSPTGVGSATVSFSYAANASGAPRSGVITIGGQTFTVTQAGSAPNILIRSGSTDIRASAAASQAYIFFTASRSWTAQSDAAWLSISQTSGGRSAPMPAVRWTANTTNEHRTGVITIDDVKITVTQKAGGSQAAGTTANVFIETQTDVVVGPSSIDWYVVWSAANSWNAVVNVPWLTFNIARARPEIL